MSTRSYDITISVLYYVLLPLLKLFYLIVTLLQLILAPFIYLVQVIYHLCALPFNIAAKFEVALPCQCPLYLTNKSSPCGTLSAAQF